MGKKSSVWQASVKYTDPSETANLLEKIAKENELGDATVVKQLIESRLAFYKAGFGLGDPNLPALIFSAMSSPFGLSLKKEGGSRSASYRSRTALGVVTALRRYRAPMGPHRIPQAFNFLTADFHGEASNRIGFLEKVEESLLGIAENPQGRRFGQVIDQPAKSYRKVNFVLKVATIRPRIGESKVPHWEFADPLDQGPCTKAVPPVACEELYCFHGHSFPRTP